MSTIPGFPQSDSHQTIARESRTVQRLMDLYRIARDSKRSLYPQWTRNYRLVNNRFNNNASNWIPNPKDSEIWPTCASLIGWIMDQNMMAELIPAADPSQPSFTIYNNLCRDLEDVLHSTWSTEKYDAQIKLILWDAITYSVGIGKAVWDNSAAGGEGDAMLRRVDPWTFYPDPDATSLDDLEYCVEVRRYSKQEIIRRFPHAETWIDLGDEGSGQIDERPRLNNDSSIAGKANPGVIPQSGAWPGSGSAPGNFDPRRRNGNEEERDRGYVVYEFWIKENDIWYDDHSDVVPTSDDDDDEDDHDDGKRVDVRWRCVVIANNQILMDEYADELWSYGTHPYERYAFDDMGEFYGVSLVEHLSSPQININRLLTAMQQNAELVGNPIFLESANSGLNRVGIINRPGQRLTLNGAAAMQNKPDWLKPPEMPASVMALVQFWIGRMENISGLSPTQKGVVPTQRSAEGTVANAQEAAMVRVRSALENLEFFLRGLVYKICDLMTNFYNEDRIIAVVGQDGEKASKVLFANHFLVPGKEGQTPLRFAVSINAGSEGPTSRAARIAEADKLLALGAVDDQYVLNVRGIQNASEILERLYTKRQKGLIGSGPGQRQRSGRTQ